MRPTLTLRSCHSVTRAGRPTTSSHFITSGVVYGLPFPWCVTAGCLSSADADVHESHHPMTYRVLTGASYYGGWGPAPPLIDQAVSPTTVHMSR